MWFDVNGVRRVRVCRVSGVRSLAWLVAALMNMRVRAQLLAVLAVRALLVLEVTQPLIVSVYLIPQCCVLYSRSLLIQFQAPNAIQSLQINPPPPPHAYAVHNKSGYDVGLMTKVYN